MASRFLMILFCLTLGACAAKRIPGTEIIDNGDSRAILAVIEKYRAALEARDAEAIYALLDPSFQDNGGSVALEDDMDYQNAREKLKERLSWVDQVRVEMNVREIRYHDNLAAAVYSYDTVFKVPALTPRRQTEGDIKEMVLKRNGGEWKIVSGI